MKKILALICIFMSLMLIFCSCDIGGNSETDTKSETVTEAPTETETETETETDSPTEAEPTDVTYKVTVVDGDGNPIAGATVQLCVGDICRLPTFTDENGIAMLEFPEDDYTAKVFATGYASDEDGYTFPSDSYELTITLTKAE